MDYKNHNYLKNKNHKMVDMGRKMDSRYSI